MKVVNSSAPTSKRSASTSKLATCPSAPVARIQVLNFLQPIDQHRALASRLLQRCCVCIALGVKWNDVILAQTKARKPFTTNTKPPSAPNFNFNVSHEVSPTTVQGSAKLASCEHSPAYNIPGQLLRTPKP